ncbi:MAG: hypothetical protein J0L84_00845 [Verrucomicrobia bacterium]|nr:hypothetical protein [Verrucomicrobiota bacterium]
MTKTLRLRDRRDVITRYSGFHLLTSLPDQREAEVRLDGTVLVSMGPTPPAGGVVVSLRGPEGHLLFTRELVADLWTDPQVLLLEFDAPLPPSAPSPGPARSPVNGRLLDLHGARSLDNIQVVFFAGDAGSAAGGRPLASVVTEAGGYFSLIPPAGPLESVFAVVGVPTRAPRHAIALTPGPEGQPAFPSPVLVVVELAPADAESKSDCGCQALGDFHTRDRVLEEFSYCSIVRTTDPEIQAFTVEEPAEIELGDLVPPSPSGDPGVRDDLVFEVRDFTLMATRAANSPRRSGGGVAAPAVAAPTVNLRSTKVLRSVAQAFLDQHGSVSRANLPQLIEKDRAVRQKTTVQKSLAAAVGRSPLNALNLVDWDETPTQYMATSIAYGHVLHFKQTWVADGYSLGDLLYSLPLAPGQKKQVAIVDFERREQAVNSQQVEYRESLQSLLSRDRDIHEITRGVITESLDASSRAHVASGAAGIGGAIGPIVFGAAGGYSRSWSSASQDSMRSIAASNLQSLTDRTVQSASASRSQRSTVVQSVSQNEALQVTTETVANYNHCHAITIQYFEVLRHFKVLHRLADVQECLFVPLPLASFDLDKARRWREPLLATLRDRALRPAFDALDRVEDRWEHSHLPATTVAAEPVRALSGYLKVAFRFARPADRLVTPPEGGEATLEFDATQWEWMMPLLGMDPAEFFNRHLKDSTARDSEFQRRLGTLIARAIVDALELRVVGLEGGESAPLGLDATLAGEHRAGAPLEVTLRVLPPISHARMAIQYLKLALPGDLPLPAFTAITVRSGGMSYRSDHYAGALFNHRTLNDDLAVGDSVLIATPLSREEMRNPRNDDLDLANRLLHHLNANLEYYHTMIFTRMSPERRFMLLDGIQISMPREDETAPLEWRSVASVVENKLLTVVGNSLVLPVVPGLNLNPEFRFATPPPADGSRPRTLLDYYQPQQGEPIRLSVPTKGVFAESMMGACNSCETIDEKRFWRWEQSPIPDSPTAINPIGTESRRTDPGNLQPAPLASPVVNIQNAPAAPDPSGTGALLEQLGKADAFRDITGLSQNQGNALAGLQQSLSSAQSFATLGVDWNRTRLEAQAKEKRLATAAALFKDGKLNADLFEKVLLDSGDSPELARVKANNQAEASGAITPEQRDAMNPETRPQRTARMRQDLAAIDEAVQRGDLSAAEGQRLRAEVVRRDLEAGPGSPAAQAKDLAEKFPGGVTSVQVGKDGDITLTGPASTRDTSLVDVVSVNPANRLTFGRSEESLSGTTLLLAALRPAAAARRASSHWINASPGRIELLGETSETVTVRAIVPGRAEVIFEVRDAANAVVDYQRIPLSVPRYYEVVEAPTVGVNNDLVPPGVNNPDQFASVLTYARLLDQRVPIYRRARAAVSELLRGLNVRLAWRMMDEQPPAQLPAGKLSTVNIGGFVGTNDQLGGATINGVDGDYRDGAWITMGRLLDFQAPGRQARPDSRSRLGVAIQPLLDIVFAPTVPEATRAGLMPLWQEIFARAFGFTIAHEVSHTILRRAFNISGHSSEFDPDDMMTAGADPLDIGLEITNPAAFPAAGSFFWGPMKALNARNLAQMKTLVPVESDPPFNEFAKGS